MQGRRTGFNIPGKDKSTEVRCDITSDSLRDPVTPLPANKGDMKQRLVKTKADLDETKEDDEEASNTKHGIKKLNTDNWVGEFLTVSEKTVFYNDPRLNRYKRWQDMSKKVRNKDQHMRVYIYETEAALRKASEAKLELPKDICNQLGLAQRFDDQPWRRAIRTARGRLTT